MNKKTGRFLCVILLLSFFALAAENARNASITVDEGLHIASGYTILVTGDYRLVEEHPPFIKLWMALPLLTVSDLTDPTSLPAWDNSSFAATESVPLLQMAQQLLFSYLPVDKWLLPARMMCIGIGVLLLSLLYRWAADIGGTTGGILVIALAAFDPNIIAHSATAGTDIGSAFFILLTLWFGGKFFKVQSFRLALLTGLSMGLALASKLTGVLVTFPVGFIGLINVIKQSREPRIKTLLNVIVLFFVAFFVLWCVYRFEVGYIDGLSIPLPMPSHATPVFRLLDHAGGGHQAYLFGENRNVGWWYYFPMAFLVKTPFPILLLFPLAIISRTGQAVWKRNDSSAAVLFFVIYTAVSLVSSLNIGYRHVLPLLCFIYIGTGAFINIKKTWTRILCFILIISQAVNTTYHSPYLLGWFNSISGGVKNGWRYLADSNTDWGQGYKALAWYQDKHGIPRIHLAGFVFYDPAIYGINYIPLPPMGGDTPAILPNRFAPPPGHYAISLTSLDGIPLADNEMYDWFRWRPPTGRIANAIYYYHVTEEDTVTNWTAQCTKPVPPLDQKVINEGFGNSNSIRYIPFDCTQSWIIPNTPAGNGVYIIHGSLLENNLVSKLHYSQPQAKDSFINGRLQYSDITYHQRLYRDNPSFALFRPQSLPVENGPEITVFTAAPAESPPINPSDRVKVEAPAAFDGPLDFLGLRTSNTGQTLEVETWWQVKQAIDGSKSLSIMAHVLGKDGENLGVADGLGINPVDWLTGDIIIQRHTFSLHSGSSADEYILRTGLYWLENGERMRLLNNGSFDAVYVELDR